MERASVGWSVRSSGGGVSVPRRGRAFTLIEVLVAIGAIAVISVGLAAIFDSIGKTVSGGRRASAVNAYAQLMERQLARDFAQMTRDGFMVVRQQWADVNADNLVDAAALGPANRDNVELYRDQPLAQQRPRRIDEVMFFAKGKFESVRRPLFPTVVATANEARIYYGMGQPRVPRVRTDVDPVAASEAQASAYQRPQLDDVNGVDTSAGGDGRTIAWLGRRAPTPNVPNDNPSRFASNWVLLRHATLLSQPNATRFEPVSPSEFFNVRGTTAAAIAAPTVFEGYQRDSEYQIALQPAAATIFRSLNRIVPTYYQKRDRFPNCYYFPTSVLSTANDFLSTGAACPPQFSSGLVDVATTDLQEIRRMVEQCYDPNPPASPPKPNVVMPSFYTQASVRTAITSVPGGESAPAPLYAGAVGVGSPTPAGLPASPSILDAVHAWMSDAMPTESRQDAKTYRAAYYPPAVERFDPPGVRMRCEPAAPDITGTLAYRSDVADAAGNVQLERTVALNNQFMITASNLLPRCSEFIVDWSYGKTDRSGQIVWHGLPRKAVVNGVDQWVTRPYPFAADPADPNTYELTRQVPVDQWIDANDHSLGVKMATLTTPPRLVYGIAPDRATTLACLSSYFGYNDPMYPDLNRNGSVRVVGRDNPGEDGMEGYPVPWPWPTMIRLTVSIADSVDPSIETTFQFVFKVPDGSVGVE